MSSTMNSGKDGFVEHFSKYTDLDTLTEEIAAELLERITIWPNGRLDISLYYSDEMSCIATDMEKPPISDIYF